MIIQEWISEKRADFGYSLDELSELAGLARSQIHNIERGESNITISAIVRLCFALDISGKEFLRKIGTPYPRMSLDTESKPNDELPFITIVDIENLLSFYNRRGYASLIKGFLYKSFYKIMQLAPPKFSAYKEIGAAYDMIGQCIKSERPKSHAPLPSPGIIDTDYYYQISRFGGALTPYDFGEYLKSLRKTKLDYSVRKMGKTLELSHSTISRIESGKSDLSSFLDLYKMEIILSQSHQWIMPGYMILIRWLAEEFKIGIVRNRNKNLEPPPIGWVWRDYIIAETLVRLNRWYRKHNLEEYWTKTLRSFMNKLNTGEIPPFTKDENIYGLWRPSQTDATGEKASNVKELKELFKKIQEGEIPIKSK